MPIKRKQGETKDEFITRCIPIEIKSGKGAEQASAICYSYWDEKQLSAVKRIRNKNLFSKVSIDYDDTLSTDRGKELAKQLIADGNDVYIISARRDKEGMLGVAKDLGIPESRVYATGSNKAKVEKVKQLGIKKHIDNNSDVVNQLPKVGQKFIELSVGVPHYTVDGILWTGPTHKDASGRLMTGEVHTEDSEYLYHEDELKNLSFESYTDYPKAAIQNAQAALNWAEKNGWGSCGTPVGKQRANQLAKGEAISEETISRMAGFERHRQNSNKDLGDGCGRLMWLAWGGDEGVEWAGRKLEQIRKEKPSINFEKIRAVVSSSNVDKMMWNSETLELVIRFNDGSTYTYVGVNEELFNNVSEGRAKPITSGENEYGSWEKGVAPSVGAAVHQYLIQKGVGFNPGGNFR